MISMQKKKKSGKIYLHIQFSKSINITQLPKTFKHINKSHNYWAQDIEVGLTSNYSIANTMTFYYILNLCQALW